MNRPNHPSFFVECPVFFWFLHTFSGLMPQRKQDTFRRIGTVHRHTQKSLGIYFLRFRPRTRPTLPLMFRDMFRICILPTIGVPNWSFCFWTEFLPGTTMTEPRLSTPWFFYQRYLFKNGVWVGVFSNPWSQGL